MKHIVLTGATGNFGSELMDELLKQDVLITLFVRAKNTHEAHQRIQKKNKKIIDIIPVDLTDRTFGLSESMKKKVTMRTTHIIHAAASTRFTLPLEDARRNNVLTTKHMISFAHACPKLSHFGCISTAFVAGKRTGLIRENELEHVVGFLNSYEQSKYEAEILVRLHSNALPISIYRPSFLLTNKKNGVLDALTFCIRLALKNMLPVIPGSPESILNMLPARFASELIANIFFHTDSVGKTFHITDEKTITVGEIIRSLEEKEQKSLHITFSSSPEDYEIQLKHVTKYKPHLKLIYKKLNTFLPELWYPKIFDQTNLRNAMPGLTFPAHPFTDLF